MGRKSVKDEQVEEKKAEEAPKEEGKSAEEAKVTGE